MYCSTYTETLFRKQHWNIFKSVIHLSTFHPKYRKWATTLPEQRHCQYFHLASLAAICLEHPDDIWCFSKWRDKNGRGYNEWSTAEGQSVYIFPWHWLLEETVQMFPWTNRGKADGTDLRAETLPYIITYNCTNSDEMRTTSKHFTRPLPFLMIIPVLREYWVFTAKSVQSLLEWIWPSPLLDDFIPVLFSSALCFYRFQLFFLKPLCAQEIIRKSYKHAIIMLDEWDLFWYFGPNDPSLPSFQGINCS